MTTAALRQATGADVEAIAAVWYEAWHDAHDGNVPANLVADRTLEHFRHCATDLVGSAIVADDATGVVGFVKVDGDELDLLFVARRGRGTGVAAALLGRGEADIAERFERSWLEVVAGNARARRFYARMGWVDEGSREWVAETSAGRATVVYRRYEKWLRP